MKNKYDIILLLSGGLDSVALLKMALNMGLNPFCLLFDYGQKHVKELEVAVKLCKFYDVSYQVIKLDDWKVNSKLTGDLKTKYQGVSEYYVPGRNLVFLSFAYSMAESMSISKIWYGANYQDRMNLFPDCYQEWIVRLNDLLSISGSKKIKVEAPFLGMYKETVELMAKELFNIKKEEVHSGYSE